MLLYAIVLSSEFWVLGSGFGVKVFVLIKISGSHFVHVRNLLDGDKRNETEKSPDHKGNTVINHPGKATKNPQALPPTPPALWQALTESTAPMLSVAPDGKPQRLLQFDKDQRTLVLQVDTDGDGRFDTRREFREDSVIQPGLVREP